MILDRIFVKLDRIFMILVISDRILVIWTGLILIGFPLSFIELQFFFDFHSLFLLFIDSKTAHLAPSWGPSEKIYKNKSISAEEAPSIHRGGTKEVPGRQLHIDQSPKASHIKRTERRTIDRSGFDPTCSGHKARRIL